MPVHTPPDTPASSEAVTEIDHLEYDKFTHERVAGMFRLFASAIQAFLDTILPPKERLLRLAEYSIDDVVLAPEEHDACGVAITTLMSYRSPTTEDLIRALKYDKSGTAARLLADVLAEYLREEIANVKAFSTKPIVLVPVPLHSSRERERGFNQITRVLEALPPEFKDGTLARIESRALVRSRATQQQTRLSRTERLNNVKDAFELRIDGSAILDAHVILIDDVTTTGATLSEAARPCKGRAASLTLLALAHA